MLDSKEFDLWANDYDKSVHASEESNEYPFAGYKDVLNYIYKKIKNKSNANILDIGFGTGILTKKLYDENYKITGIDFSSNMIEIAKHKMPKATLIKWDFASGLPNELKNKHFDYVISTYAIHHLTDSEKITFIKKLFSVLNEDAKILLGDVSFSTRTELEKCKEKYNDYWDEDEVYFVAGEIKEKLDKSYLCEYVQISHCAGVLSISKR